MATVSCTMTRSFDQGARWRTCLASKCPSLRILRGLQEQAERWQLAQCLFGDAQAARVTFDSAGYRTAPLPYFAVELFDLFGR